MLNIVENYKVLFRSFLRNELGWGGMENPSEPVADKIIDDNNSWDNIDELIENMISDGKIEGDDLPVVKQLSKKFKKENERVENSKDSEKQNLYKESRTLITDAVSKMLEGGYTVNSKVSYETISWLIKIIMNHEMPKYEDIIKKISMKKEWFSITLEKGNLIINESAGIGRYNTDKAWYIDNDWQFVKGVENIETDFWDDVISNGNNEINIPSYKREEVMNNLLKDNYKNIKISEKQDWMVWLKPRKTVVLDDLSLLEGIVRNRPSERKNAEKLRSKMREEIKQINDWNKEAEALLLAQTVSTQTTQTAQTAPAQTQEALAESIDNKKLDSAKKFMYTHYNVEWINLIREKLLSNWINLAKILSKEKIFLEETSSAIIKFQKQKKLTVDGLVWTWTLKALWLVYKNNNATGGLTENMLKDGNLKNKITFKKVEEKPNQSVTQNNLDKMNEKAIDDAITEIKKEGVDNVFIKGIWKDNDKVKLLLKKDYKGVKEVAAPESIGGTIFEEIPDGYYVEIDTTYSDWIWDGDTKIEVKNLNKEEIEDAIKKSISKYFKKSLESGNTTKTKKDYNEMINKNTW